QLIISDENGCTDSFSLTHLVSAKPEALFTADNTCATTGLSLTNETQVGDGQSFRAFDWNWGDGENTRATLPSKAYDTPGFFDIRLIAETENGCLDTATQSIQIYANPTASFDVVDACFPDSLTFLNQSTIESSFGDAVSQIVWDFGDGSRTTNLEVVPKAYINPGNYTVTFEAVSNNGCSDDATRNLQIDPRPLPPTPQSDTVCFGEAGRLIALPDNGNHLISWYKDLSDELPFLESKVYLIPQVVNSDLFWVQATTPAGCVSDRLPVFVEMWPGRTPEIISNDSVLEVPNAQIALSIKDDAYVSYNWDLGDGNSSISSEPVHEYRTPGKYLIRVQLVDAQGCEYEAEQLIEVREYIALWVPSAFSPNGDNNNDVLQVEGRLIQDLRFEVFHRWGGQIYASDDLNPAWDGRTASGTLVNPGVYVYKAAYVDINGRAYVKTGTITVLR
ncbi:MAG: PKD domain-containing protein, partial [Bacteroidota bacterium]